MQRIVKYFFRHWQMALVVAFLAYRSLQDDARQSTLLMCATALAVVGVLMNLVVILANGGMPARVLDEEISDDERDDYHVLSESTRLAFLADWIPFGNLMISPGDIVLTIAVALILLQQFA